MSSLKNVFLAIFLGGMSGYFLQENALYLKPLGDIFIKLIKMVIVPLIFFAVISGMTSAGNIEALKRVGARATFAYFVSTLCAVCIGFGSAYLLTPGQGIHLENLDKISPPAHSIFDICAQIIPDNAIGAMASGNIIQVVFFALFTGYCLLRLPEATGKGMIKGVQNLAQLVFQMVIHTKGNDNISCDTDSGPNHIHNTINGCNKSNTLNGKANRRKDHGKHDDGTTRNASPTNRP